MEDHMSGNCGNGSCGCGSKGWMAGSMRRKPFFGLLVLAAVIYLALLSRNAAKQYGTIGAPPVQRDSISVDAVGKVTALPDIASVSIGVKTEKKSIADAQKENSLKMNAIIEKLQQLGVAKEDIQTSQYSIDPAYDYPDGKEILRGYEVRQDVDVKVRKLDSISDILASAASLGANQIGGIGFTIDDPETLRQQARLKGIEAAKKKAQDLAAAAGVKLGKVVGFSESSSSPESPVYYAKDMVTGMGGASNPSPNVQPGSQDVIVNVTVQYEIL